MKNILIIEFGYENFDDQILSGSGKLIQSLYFEFNKQLYNVYICVGNENIKDSHIFTLNNIPKLKYNYIIINASPDIEQFEHYTKHLNLSQSKIIFIAHNNYYQEVDYQFFKKYCNLIIFVSEFNYNIEHEKMVNLKLNHDVIHFNFPEQFAINNLNIFSKKDIIMSYHPCKGYHNEFIKHVFPIIQHHLKDINLHICFPKYDDNQFAWLQDLSNEHILIYQSINTNQLINLYSKCAVSIFSNNFEETLPCTVMESCLTYTFPISWFNDGAKYICSKNYIDKYKLKKEYNYEQIAFHILNVIKKYSYLIDDIINERKYIIKNFNKDNTIKKYIEVITKL